MSKTLGLALGSGGSHGVAHIGFMLALEEEGIKPDFISGCSMGSVVGGCYASGMPLTQIRDIVLQLKARDILDLSPGFVANKGILRTKKITDLLENYLGDLRIEDMKIPFSCVATELYSGKLYEFTSGPAALSIRASSSIPCVFRPVEYGGMMFVDGGCLCRVPSLQVKNMGADVVVAVDALSNTFEPVESVNNILDLVLRVFDIMDSHQTVMHRELEGDVSDLIISPEIKDMSQYVVKDLDKAFDAGYKYGKEYAPKIAELLAG